MTKDERIKRLEKIIIDTLWMAARYADGRRTWAPLTVNQAIMEALDMGVKIEVSSDSIEYAKDGMFGDWIPEERRFRGVK